MFTLKEVLQKIKQYGKFWLNVKEFNELQNYYWYFYDKYPELEEFIDYVVWLENVTKILSDKIDRLNSDKNIPNYLYIIKDTSNNLYKLWISSDPHKRYKQLLIWNPFLEFIDSMLSKDAIEDEKYFHKKYKNKKIWWEWFKLNKCDIIDIYAYYKSY